MDRQYTIVRIEVEDYEILEYCIANFEKRKDINAYKAGDVWGNRCVKGEVFCFCFTSFHKRNSNRITGKIKMPASNNQNWIRNPTC